MGICGVCFCDDDTEMCFDVAYRIVLSGWSHGLRAVWYLGVNLCFQYPLLSNIDFAFVDSS